MKKKKSAPKSKVQKAKRTVQKAKKKPVAKKKTKISAKAKPAPKKQPKAKVAKTPKPGVIAPANGILLGYVEDYFAKIGVIALTLKASILVGQKIQVLGHTTHFEQSVGSMQVDHVPVERAGPGDGIGIKVKDRARSGDHVYLLK